MEWYYYLIIAVSVVVFLLGVFVLAEFLYVKSVMGKNFGTHAYKRPGEQSENIDLLGEEYADAWKYGEVQCKQFFALPYNDFSVKTDDGLTLRGKFYKSLNPNPKATLIAVHGFRGSPEWDFGTICMFFINNYNVMYINHRGHNDSEGDSVSLGVKEWQDMKLWINKAEEFAPDCKIILHGVSMGGAIVLSVSDEEICNKVAFIVSDCAFESAEKQLAHIVAQIKIPAFPVFNFCKFWFEKYTGVKINSKSPLDGVKNSKVPILFVHGKSDKFVPFSMAQTLYDACPTEKDYLWVEGAGHGSSYFIDRESYEKKYAEFSDKYCN